MSDAGEPSPALPPRRDKPLPLWLVTLGGAGMLPKAPGTYGSLVATILVGLVFLATGPSEVVLIVGLVLFSALCVPLGGWAQTYYGRKDPGPCVLDEAAGICLTLLLLPHLPGAREAWVLLAGFIAFRIFDVTKPPPARQLEELPAGWGILVDDLAAAVYANLLCQLIFRVVVHI
jgi:phosphatidylglycerophosphatase A